MQVQRDMCSAEEVGPIGLGRWKMVLWQNTGGEPRHAGPGRSQETLKKPDSEQEMIRLATVVAVVAIAYAERYGRCR
jgi:hypothetical protein